MSFTSIEVLREFAAFPRETSDFGVRIRSTRTLFRLEPEFDIESQEAIEAEKKRLEQRAEERRIGEALVNRLLAQRRVLDAQERRNAIRRPCKVCGGRAPANRLGVIATHCNASCRSAALCQRRAAEKKCRRARCPHGAEPGKTYCRDHLDGLAAQERERRRLRKVGGPSAQQAGEPA